jgi:hypothetical protein
MKGNIVKIFWGGVLILLGGLSLADKLGYINLESITNQMWSIIFTVTSVAFFLSYFMSGVKQWGWLFPALIFAALGLIMSLILGDIESPIIALPILLSIAIPFYVGYLVNRKHWRLLITAWILTVISVIPQLSETVHSDLIGPIFLYATALPFFIIYLVNRQRRWALITAASAALIGTLPLVDYFVQGDIVGTIIMFLFALPFLVIYFVSKKNWWALIPAGVFVSIGLVALLDYLLPNQAYIPIGNFQVGIYSSILFLGFAITFGLLWLLRASQPTDWAKYPAIGLLIIALLAFLIGKSLEDFLPGLIPLIIGVVIIAWTLRKKKTANHLPLE